MVIDAAFGELCRVFEEVLDRSETIGHDPIAVAHAMDDGPLTAWEASSSTDKVIMKALATLATIANRRGLSLQFEIALRSLLAARLERLAKNIESTKQATERERDLPSIADQIGGLAPLDLWKVTTLLWAPPPSNGEGRTFPNVEDTVEFDTIPYVDRLSLPVALLDPFCDLLDGNDFTDACERGTNVPMLKKACRNRSVKSWSVAFAAFLTRFKVRKVYRPTAAKFLGEISMQLLTQSEDMRPFVAALYIREPLRIALCEGSVGAEIEVLGTVDGTYRDDQDEVVGWWRAAGPGGMCAFNLMSRKAEPTLLRLSRGIVRGTLNLDQVR